MEHNMQQTSLLAFAEIRPKMSELQAQLLEVIEAHQPVCNRQLSEITGIPINSITPRVLALRKKQQVIEDHVGVDVNGRKAIFWSVR